MSIPMDIIRLQEDSKHNKTSGIYVALRDYLDYNLSTLISIHPINIRCLGNYWLQHLDDESLDTYVKRANINLKNCEHVLELKDNKYKVGEKLLRCLLKTEPDTLRDVLEAYQDTKVMVYPFKDLITTNYLLEKGAETILNLKVKYCEYDVKQDILRVDVGFISR